jgi:hypothetical protein
MYKLCFYVPETHVEIVKEVIFAVGAGQIGNYDHCCWQVLGRGQFRPLKGSDPFIGEAGRVEQVAEFKVEMICSDEFIQPAVTALKKSHPYEEVAYDVWQLTTSF